MNAAKRYAYSNSIVVPHDNLAFGNATMPFRTPTRFTGHLYVTGKSDEQAIIAVGSDEYSRIDLGRGFSALVGSSDSFAQVRLFRDEQDPPHTWRLKGLPAQFTMVTVTFVGSVAEPPVLLGVIGYVEP